MRNPQKQLLLMFLFAAFLAAAPGNASSEPEDRWSWSGAVTSNSAQIKAGGAPEPLPPIEISADPDFQNSEPVTPRNAIDGGRLGRIGTYFVVGLDPDTLYYYRWADQNNSEPFGRFRSMPEGASSFTFAFGSCSDTASNHPVYDEILAHEALFFLHTGDFHYRDIRKNDPNVFFDAMAQALVDSQRQNAFFRKQQIPYMWDDHDYGPNNSDNRSPSREAALKSYRSVVPHYPFFKEDAGPLDPVGQAFSAGRIRFLMPDLRSHRNHNGLPDGPEKTMMGLEQREWLEAELLAASDHYALIVLLSGVPWIASETKGDHWGAYAYERRVISDFIVENEIDNIVMICGDAHMLAADDGSNNTFASNGEGPGFPVLQAAAMSREGSKKGGPYSHGAFPGKGQYGLLHVNDDGSTVRVTFEGYRHESGKLLELEHKFD